METGGGSKPAQQTQAERLRDTAATHTWVGAAVVPLNYREARTADLRAAVKIKADTTVQVLDAYCHNCRQNWEACAHLPCPAKDPHGNEHLRGGTPGERKKRTAGPRRPPLPTREQVARP